MRLSAPRHPYHCELGGTFANATEMPGHTQLLPEEIISMGTALGPFPLPCREIHVAQKDLPLA